MYSFFKIFFLSVLCCSVGYSQFEKSELAPPGIKWYEKRSKNFIVYFPKELDSIANYTISFLENNINKIKLNPEDKIRKSRIILHNQNSIPNAFVTSSPRRSEFYVNAKTESPHFLHNNNWVDLLAVHEFRHLVQREVGYNNFFNKMVHYFFGESQSSLISRSTAPNWYWEGDAVYLETTIGDYGRGRIPRFTLTTQMNLNSKNKIKYERQTLGSFKYKTPNEYETGYLMVKYLNEKFSQNTFNKIVKKANKQSFLPVPFYRALKKETKENYKEVYKNSLASLPKKTNYITKKSLNKRSNNVFSSLIYPTVTENKDVVVIRQGYGSYQDFRVIDKSGNISLLFTPGIVNDFGRIPLAKNKIAWLEFDKDPRWDKRVYSAVKILDMRTKKLIKNKIKGYFSSLDLSPDGKNFVVLENNLNGSQSFVIYDVLSQKKIKEYTFGAGIISSLKYSNKENLIGIKTTQGEKSVFIFNLNLNKKNTLFSTKKNIGWPTYQNEILIFSTSHNGFEELFIHETKTKETFILDGHKLGSYYPFLTNDNSEIYYSSIGEFGFDVYKARIETENLSAKTIKQNKSKTKPIKNFPTKNFPTKKTNRFFEAIKPTSWGISDYSLSEKGLDYITLGLDSRGLFGDLLFGGGYRFDIRDKKTDKYFNLSYQGFYPIIDFSISSSNDSFTQNIILNNQESYDTIYDANIKFKTQDFSVGVRVPLSYTRGKYFTSFLGSLSLYHERFKDFYTTSIGSASSKFPLVTTRDTRSYFSTLLLYSRKYKKGKRQVYNRFEQTVLIEGKKTLENSDYSGSYVRSDIYLAFPGFKNTHSARLKTRVEAQEKVDYLFRNNINFITGYQNLFNFSNFVGWGLEYELPLFYPDFAIGPIAYIQRVRGSTFLNGGSINGFSQTSPNIQETPKSAGVGFTLDLNLFRQSFLFEFGVKYAYVFDVNEGSQGSTIQLSLGSITF